MGKKNKDKINVEIDFIDREETQERFFKKYEVYKEGLENKDISVVSYYGYGGVGKSSLMQQLKKKIKSKYGNNLVIRYDLGECPFPPPILKVVFALKQLLVDECGLKFPDMDLAQFIFDCINGNNPEIPKVQPKIEEKTRNKVCFDIFGEMPLVGMLFKGVKAWDEVAAAVKSEDKRIELSRLKDASALDLENKILDLFIDELKENLKDKKEPLVIIFDRYESLSNKRDTILNLGDADKWIYGEGGLIERVPKVLWVIAGRERLKWLDEDEEWRDSLETWNLEPLNEEFTAKYLEKGGVPKVLHKSLFDLTKGIPQYLKLCVELAQTVRDNNSDNYSGNISIEDFGSTKEKIIDRLIGHLPDYQVNLLTILSCYEKWTDGMIKTIVPKFLSSFNEATYSKIKDISFVEFKDGIYSVENVAREAIYAQALKNQKLVNNVLENVLDYQKNVKEDRDSNDMQYMMHYALEQYKDDDDGNQKLKEFFIDYVEKYIDDKSLLGLKTEVNNFLSPFYQRAMMSKDPELKILAFYEYGLVLSRLGEYKKSLEIFKKALDLCENSFDEDDLIVLKIKSYYAGSLSDVGRYDEALKLQEEVLSLRKKILGEEHPDTISEMNSLANSLSDVGRLDEALETYEKILVLSRKVLGEEHPDTIIAMNNLANSLSDVGRHDEAFTIREEVLVLSRKILGEEHPETVSAMNNLTVSLSAVGRHDEALEMAEEVLALRKKILGEEHPETIKAMSNLANTLRIVGRHDEALEMAEEVLAFQKKIIGEEHPDTIIAMKSLAASLWDVGRYDEALKLQEEVLSLCKKILGEEHPGTLQAMNNLVTCIGYLGRYDESLKLEEEALALRKKIFGEEHPDTIAAMQGLKNRLSLSGRRDKALKLAEDMFLIYKKTLGEENPETISVMEDLAKCLRSAAQYEKALKLDENVLCWRRKVLGEKHKDTINSMINLSYDLSKVGRDDEARELKEKWINLTLGI